MNWLITFLGCALASAAAAEAAAGAAVDDMERVGRAALARHDIERAASIFSQAVALYPTSAVGYYGRGLTYLSAGDLDKAISDLSEAARLDPSRGGVFRNRGIAFMKKGAFGRAIADCDEALRLDARDVGALRCRAFCYAGAGRYDRATRDFTAALAADPRDATAYRGRAEALRLQGSLLAALKDFDSAIALDPGSVEAYCSRGLVYRSMAQSDRAIADFAAAVRIEPGYQLAYFYRAETLAVAGQFEKALSDYDQAVRLAPADPRAHFHRARVYAQERAWGKAVADTDTAIRLMPAQPAYYEFRAALWIQKGDYGRGADDLALVLRLDPKDAALTFRAEGQEPIPAEALRRGREQVRQMLRDRPAMAQYPQAAIVLSEWAARKFAGEDARREVTWDPSSPLGNAPSEARWASEMPCSVRVRAPSGEARGSDAAARFAQMWSCLVFSLYKVANCDDLARIDADAAARRLSKAEFVAKTAECASRAAEMTRAFYIRVLLPLARQHRLPSEPLEWFVGARFERGQAICPCSAREDCGRRYARIVLQALLEKGASQEAIRTATALLQEAETVGERAEIQSIRGAALQKAGRLDDALADLNASISLEPTDFGSRCRRAAVHQEMGHLDSAISDWTDAIRLEPHVPAFYSMRAVAYLEKGEVDKCIADCSVVIAACPLDPSGYDTRASAYLRCAQWDKAIADLSKVLKVMPRAAAHAFLLSRGEAYEGKGDYGSAIADYTRALDHAPFFTSDAFDARRHCLRGRAYLGKGDTNLAIREETDAIRLSATLADAYRNRAAAYARIGDLRRSAADLERARHVDRQASTGNSGGNR